MDHRRRKEVKTKAGKTKIIQIADGTMRRELGVLQAAINHWHAEHGPLTSIPEVTLAPSGPSRERWLTRSEAAALLAGALGWYRETWCDVATRKQHSQWRRYKLGINRHLARFILIGLYTGTRRGAILGLQWLPNLTSGWVDIDRGILHRRAAEQRETKKRKPPARLGNSLAAHLRRWKRIDDSARAQIRERIVEQTGEDAQINLCLHVVSWNGRPVASVRTSWDAALELAWLGPDVTPHTLRHTKATWLMQAGVDPWEAAGYLGMSMKTLEDTYGHHHPDWQKQAAEI
jgi:integrase